MAAGSTETFASTSQGLGCFNSNLLKTAQDKFWTAEVMATASTGGFWEDDPEMEIKKKINELKHKFHVGRQLQIKHLPRDVTEEFSTVLNTKHGKCVPEQLLFEMKTASLSPAQPSPAQPEPSPASPDSSHCSSGLISNEVEPGRTKRRRCRLQGAS
ncbi:Uncharacterized protein GBIM_19351 [Gryllus bimaculatus]|nr:Uncharacterized protein GBIM_19351 [Gryllus bimaculatus]